MPVAVTLQLTVKMIVLLGGAGRLGICMPGPVMLAIVKLTGNGHKAAPTAEQVMLVQLKPGEVVSLKTALLTVAEPELVMRML